jgi:hypothetical protein
MATTTLASLERVELPTFRFVGERSIQLIYRDMASSEGLEPPISGFGGQRSVQLSYEDM